MYGNHDARRLEHLTVLTALAIVVVVSAAAVVGARSLSHRLGNSTQVVGAAAHLPVEGPPLPATTTTTSTTVASPAPSFTTSTTVAASNTLSLQLAGQAVPSGANIQVTATARLVGNGAKVVGRPVSISNGGLCTPPQWHGITDAQGQATSTFSCGPVGPDVPIVAVSGSTRTGMVLHR